MCKLSNGLKTGVLVGWMAVGTLLMACPNAEMTMDAVGTSCGVTAATACPTPAPRYADVQPIIEQRCVVCHSGNTPQWPLTTYKNVADWYDEVRFFVESCAMPPPAANIPITPEERNAILTWIRCGHLN